MSKSLKAKIKQYLHYKGISEDKFYQRSGFTAGLLENKDIICIDKIRKIAKMFPDISLEWLIADIGTMIKSQPEVSEDPALLLIVEEKSSQLEKIIYENEKLIEELKAAKKEALSSIATTMMYMHSKEA